VTSAAPPAQPRTLYWLTVAVVYLYLPAEHYLLYVPSIVPHLGEWRSIPIGWLAAEWLPLLTALTLLGWLSTPRRAITHALVAAILGQAFGAFAAAIHEPGFSESDASSNPLAFWTVDLLLLATLFAIPMLAMSMLRATVRRRKL
jgi:hypothetical protein